MKVPALPNAGLHLAGYVECKSSSASRWAMIATRQAARAPQLSPGLESIVLKPDGQRLHSHHITVLQAMVSAAKAAKALPPPPSLDALALEDERQRQLAQQQQAAQQAQAAQAASAATPAAARESPQSAQRSAAAKKKCASCSSSPMSSAACCPYLPCLAATPMLCPDTRSVPSETLPE